MSDTKNQKPGKGFKLRTGRFSRAAALGGMAAGLASDLAGAASRFAVAATKDEVSRRFHESAASTLLKRLGHMKGLPMKMGQMLSYVDDMIPPEHRELYRETLGVLQRESEPMAFDVMEKVISESLGAPPDVVFASFDPEPVAAASIGQVYRATTHDGHDVAVKVQYPGVADAIRADLANADSLVSAMSMVLPRVDVEMTLQDLSSRLLEECDYRKEAANQTRFRELWADDPDVFIPRVFDKLCAERVITTEFVEADSWQDMLQTRSAEERSRLGQVIFRFAFGSIYTHGLFNADPHPGNYLFMKDGRVAFIDYGCVQGYDSETLDALLSVRDKVMAGVRGSEFRKALVSAYGLPEDLTEEMWATIEEYIVVCFLPLQAEQPFRYDRKYTEKLTQMTVDAKMLAAKQLLRNGVFETKRRGMVFLHRINFGLNSLLAELEASADWRALLRDIEEKRAVLAV